MIDDNSREALRDRWNYKILSLFFLNGVRKMCRNRKLLIIPVLYIIAAAVFWINREALAGGNISLPILGEIYDYCIGSLLVIVSIALFVVTLILLGKPKGAKAISDNLHRMGLVNHAGEAPVLISRSCKADNSRIIVLEFETRGIPILDWQDKQERIEAALNIRIDMIKEGKNPRRILIFAVDGNYQLPDVINWSDEMLNPESFILTLGESLIEQVTVNLAKIPHILIGGSTGSGKSVLLKLLLMQCVEKKAKVYIADFKGGVDFPPIWHQKCSIVTEEEELLSTLEEIVSELNRRKQLFRNSGSPDIDDYNTKSVNKQDRIIIGCDEIAEVLDKTGLDKAHKETVSRIEACLSMIARQGRAFGIHLILATQRPDANIIPGQIKNNIDFRVCGRADNVLSQIVLDNTDANSKIPKDSQGRFLTNSNIVLQAYWFDDREW